MDNFFSMLCSLVGGFMIYIFGGIDILLKTLLIIIVLDYLTGVLKAIYYKKLSSSIGFKGIIKKVIILMIVATSVMIQQIISEHIPIREVVITFFISNESLSLLENAASVLPVPDSLRDILIQLKDNTLHNNNNNREGEEK